jgi:organic hydroperoxide reductase OsmC/OhrA
LAKNWLRVAAYRTEPFPRPNPASLGASFDVETIVAGSLDDAQIAKLREAAENCRISRALNVPVALRVTVAV